MAFFSEERKRLMMRMMPRGRFLLFLNVRTYAKKLDEGGSFIHQELRDNALYVLLLLGRYLRKKNQLDSDAFFAIRVVVHAGKYGYLHHIGPGKFDAKIFLMQISVEP